MDNLKNNLEQREKPELIAIITHMLRQEPDLDEDILGLLIGNATPEERRVIVSWAQDALTEVRGANWSSSSRQQEYGILVLKLEKDKKDHE